MGTKQGSIPGENRSRGLGLRFPVALGERERDRAGDALAGEREGERERRAGEAPAAAPPVEETGERERTGDRERRAGERRGELPLAAGLLERRGEGVRRPTATVE